MMLGVSVFSFIMGHFINILISYKNLNSNSVDYKDLTKWIALLTRFNDGIKLNVDLEHEPVLPKMKIDFIHESEKLSITLAKMTNYVFNQSWDISIRMGALGASLG